MLATGRGTEIARAMALPVLFGMFIELVSLLVVPELYCGYMEFKLSMAEHHTSESSLPSSLETIHV